MTSKELYRLTEGTVVYAFTSSNEAEVYNGETYSPKVVGRSEINDQAQISKMTVDVSFPIDDDIGQHLLNSTIDSIIRLNIYSKDEDGTVTNIWKGRIRTTAPNDKTIKATFESIFSSNRRAGARPIYQRTCRHAVYSVGCGLRLADFQVASTVTDMSQDGLTVIVPGAAAQPDGSYSAGIIIMSDGTMRYITAHAGSTLVLIRASDTMQKDFDNLGHADVFIAMGCTQTDPVCFARFNNIENFGGWKTIPLIDPMSGKPIV